jgi:hypothetical protein
MITRKIFEAFSIRTHENGQYNGKMFDIFSHKEMKIKPQWASTTHFKWQNCEDLTSQRLWECRASGTLPQLVGVGDGINMSESSLTIPSMSNIHIPLSNQSTPGYLTKRKQYAYTTILLKQELTMYSKLVLNLCLPGIVCATMFSSHTNF